MFELVGEDIEQEHIQTELKKMKLIDLLIDNNIQWPEGAAGVVQDSDCFLKFYVGVKPVIHDIGVWFIGTLAFDPVYLNEKASDYKTAIITKQDWENRKVDKKPMFADIKVGDKVWGISQGWGVVTTLMVCHTYPIEVEFEHGDGTYTRDGYYILEDINPSLFWDEIEVKAPPKPLPDLQVDAKVFVWNNPESRLCRHFSHFDEDGVLHAFIGGETSFSSSGLTNPWSCWELAE